MATMEFIGDNASELDAIQRQWLRDDPTIDVLAICPDERVTHRHQPGEKLVHCGMIRRRIEYERS
jgi:hypothetical protein